MNRLGVLSMGRSQAVGPGISATDDDHALSGGDDFFLRMKIHPLAAPVRLRKVIDGIMNSLELASRDRKVARLLGAAGKQQRIVVPAQLGNGDIHADVGISHELDAFLH